MIRVNDIHGLEVLVAALGTLGTQLAYVHSTYIPLFTRWAEAEASVVTATMQRSVSVFGHCSLKPWQAEALQSILRGKDVLVTVPTGYGKSLIYQALPICANILRLRNRLLRLPWLVHWAPL